MVLVHGIPKVNIPNAIISIPDVMVSILYAMVSILDVMAKQQNIAKQPCFMQN